MIDPTIGGFAGKQVAVGLSSIIGFTALPGQISVILKHSSGGTLFIGGASMVTGGTLGYLVTANEALSLRTSGTFYGVAGGATVVTWVLTGLTPTDIQG